MRTKVGMIAAAMVVALGLAACARGPHATDVLSLAGPGPGDRARLVIYTPDNPLAMASDREVLVNRRRVGRIDMGGVILTDVEPGTQVIGVNSELGRATIFAVEPGETACVRVGGGLGYPLGWIVPERIDCETARPALAGKRLVGGSY